MSFKQVVDELKKWRPDLPDDALLEIFESAMAKRPHLTTEQILDIIKTEPLEIKEPDTIISRAERLRLPRTLDSGRVARLRVFRSRITDWATPSETVYEEPIIVCVKTKFELVMPRPPPAEPERKVWHEEHCYDHFHPKVVQFEDLIDQKSRMGYRIDVKDAVLAYCLVFEWARKSVIAGFLSTFPEFKDVPRLKEMVGENLSRLAREGFIEPVAIWEKRPPLHLP